MAKCRLSIHAEISRFCKIIFFRQRPRFQENNVFNRKGSGLVVYECARDIFPTLLS